NVLQYRDDGYLPGALVNYLARLGWSHGDQEIFTIPELIEKFDWEHVGANAGVFNPQKLEWLNQQWIKMTPAEEIAKQTGVSAQFAALMQERARNLNEIRDAWQGADAAAHRCRAGEDPMRVVFAVLLAATAAVAAEGFKARGFILPDGAVKIDDDRYRLPQPWDEAVKFYRRAYPPGKYTRRTLHSQTAVRAMHIENSEKG